MGLVAVMPSNESKISHRTAYGFLVSSREIEVLKRIALGETSQEIANELFISLHTVLSHRKNLLLKMDARNTAHLVSIGYMAGYMDC